MTRFTVNQFKKEMKEAIKHYGIEPHEAAKIALSNHPDEFEKISKAQIKINQEEMGLA